MSPAVLEIFDSSLQKTQVWLNEVMRELGWQDEPRKAYLALHTVLHALRDRLTIEEAVQLGAQLPLLIRGVYYDGWTLTGKPVKERHKSEFLDHVAAAFRSDDRVDPERVVRAVLKVLTRHVGGGEIEDVKSLLPKNLQELWP